MDSLTKLRQDKMESLNKLKRRGMDNISKVKRSGRDFANKYNACKMVSNSLYGSDNDDNTDITLNSIDKKTPSTLNNNVIEETKANWENYSNDKSIDYGSQMSLNSEAPTLINSTTSTSFSSVKSSRFPTMRKVSYDNSYTSTTTLDELNSSTNVTPISHSSSPSPIFSRNSSVVSSSSTVNLESPKERILDERIRLYIQKNKNTPKHLLKPNAEINTIICNHGHNEAFNEGKNQLLHYYQLPFPWRENRYIINNYRFYDSHKKSFLSIFNWYGWHNETSNIWSHLIGAMYMVYLATYEFPQSQLFQSERIPTSAKCIVYVFLAAAIKCLSASVFWHTFNGTSTLKLRRKFACVDYSGITILITASILTAEFVSLYDHKIAMFSYMFISLSLGVIGVFLNCSPKFDSPESRPLRIRFFILLASMGILSFLHATYLESFKYSTSLLSSVANKSVIWYLIGVVFYGSFIPERFRTDVIIDDAIPTTFQLSTDADIITKEQHLHFRNAPICNHNPRKGILSLWWVDYFGCSHTFWHIFVVFGVIGHYKAIIDMFSKRWL
ncbi:ADIPOR-like receptor Izh3p [Monosporozyma servazzii]